MKFSENFIAKIIIDIETKQMTKRKVLSLRDSNAGPHAINRFTMACSHDYKKSLTVSNEIFRSPTLQ
jgi:hypothetical protein